MMLVGVIDSALPAICTPVCTACSACNTGRSMCAGANRRWLITASGAFAKVLEGLGRGQLRLLGHGKLGLCGNGEKDMRRT